MTGTLYLIPTVLGEIPPSEVIPKSVFDVISRLTLYIAENKRTARRFLSSTGCAPRITDLSFYELNKHTTEEELSGFLNPAISGIDIGLISEAGVPCVADPGAKIVEMAHNLGIKVIPLPGPSSITLALMGSGLNGQSFCFHGYLPVNKKERIQKIKKIEKISSDSGQSQIFMETPFRNMSMIESIISVCHSETRLCIACDLTLKDGFVITQKISQWKKNLPDIHKRPAIFIIQK